MEKRKRHVIALAASVAVLGASLGACAPTPAPVPSPTVSPIAAFDAAALKAGDIDCMGARRGDTVSLLYQWSGQEEERLMAILAPLMAVCGIELQPESTRDQAVLNTRVQQGRPPDVAFWNLAQLLQYKDKLKAMDQLGAHRENYPEFFIQPGTIEGRWLGLPVKADVKTLIWYSPNAFKAKGYAVPETWEQLDALVEQMVAKGDVPWSMGFESGDTTGWTGSDFIQDILLVRQGPEYVQNIISGTVPYDDAGVRDAYEIYGKWAADSKYTVGGAPGTLSTNFVDAIKLVFGDPPRAMMVKQSGFTAGEIEKAFDGLEYGSGFDFFPVPGAKGLQGGTDWMMAFSDAPAVRALVKYLTSDLGGAAWARAGFDLSPNRAAAGNYTDPALIKKSEALAGTQDLTPDLGDNIPGGFGQAEWTAIVNYVIGQDLDKQLAAVARAQAAALGRSSP